MLVDVFKNDENNIVDTEVNKKYNRSESKKYSILRSVDRMRLLEKCIDDLINFSAVTNSKIFNGFKLKRYQNQFSSSLFLKLSYNIFNNEKNSVCAQNFRNSYGENAGFYISWSYHLMKWTIFLAFMFIIYHISHSLTPESLIIYNVHVKSSLKMMFILFYLLIWMTLYLFSWKTKELVLNYSWESQRTKAKDIERNREEYIPEKKFKIFSVNVYLDDWSKIISNYFFSFIITIVMITFTITSLTYIQVYYEPYKDPILKTLIYPEIPLIVPILTGIYCLFLSKLYYYIGLYLTNIENHRTETGFNRSYSVKQVIFNIICQYYSIYYILYISSVNDTCYEGNCYKYIQSYLRSIFFSYYISTLIEILIPFISYHSFRVKKEKMLGKLLSIEMDENNAFTMSTPKKLPESHLITINNMITREYSYIYKDSYLSVTGEYEQIIFLFGFVSQFILIDYWLIIFYIIYLYVQRLVDSKKIVDFFNSKLFNETKGIGIYNNVLKLICLLSVFTNLYVYFFLEDKVSKFDNSIKKITIFTARNFIVLQNILILLVFFIKVDFIPKWIEFNPSITKQYEKKAMKITKNKFKGFNNHS